jgi:hypothetical protein
MIDTFCSLYQMKTNLIYENLCVSDNSSNISQPKIKNNFFENQKYFIGIFIGYFNW